MHSDPGLELAKRRAELVALVGEKRVQQMEADIGDDYIIYGVRSPETENVELKGLFNSHSDAG